MELPQQRPLGAEGRKPTHDFLSLYIHSTAQPDPKPPSQGGGEGHLKTHDFLQPLERLEKTAAKEETNLEVVSTPEKPPPAGEHILPGGIGSYSSSHISYFNKKIPKPESGGAIFTVVQAASSADRKVDDNSNCSSYTAGSGFTFWEESAIKKGKTGKENLGERSNFVRETASGTGEWTASERPSLSSRNNHRHSFSSLYSSHHPSSEPKSQSFMEMIKSAKDSSQDDDLDEDEEFFLKMESHSPINKGELKVNVDGTSSDQKPNKPRSKHSATEQRRRSKINDRFQKLREIIPHSDQKRDKASFLLEVIEYIQFLQVKVRKYEGSDHGWNNDPPKFVPWQIRNGPAERYVDQSRSMNGDAVPPLLFATKLDDKNIGMSRAVGSTQKLVESDMKCSAVFKSIDQPSGITNKGIPFPLSLQPNVFDSGRTGGPLTQQLPRMASDGENTTTQPQSQSCHTRSCTNDGDAACNKLKEQELAIEGGTISISNVYSQGLLNTLTQALQNSGVDLSHANISVQIELGKREDGRQVAPTPTLKDNRVPSSNQGTTRPRVSNGSESDQALKKLKMGKS